MSRRVRTSSSSAATVSNSLTSATHSSVSSGSTFCLASLTSTWNADLCTGAFTEALGQRVDELEDVAGALAVQLVVELRDHDARTDLVEVVGGGQALNRLVVDGTLDVDLGVVAVGERRGGVFEVGEAVAQRVDLPRRLPRL